MLSKCANPTCSHEFHYLGDGQVFEIRLDKERARLGQGASGRKRKPVEHVWLCSDCYSWLTIGMDANSNVVVIPRRASKIQEAAAS